MQKYLNSPLLPHHSTYNSPLAVSYLHKCSHYSLSCSIYKISESFQTPPFLLIPLHHKALVILFPNISPVIKCTVSSVLSLVYYFIASSKLLSQLSSKRPFDPNTILFKKKKIYPLASSSHKSNSHHELHTRGLHCLITSYHPSFIFPRLFQNILRLSFFPFALNLNIKTSPNS